MRRDTKLVPIKKMKVGDKFHNLKHPGGSLMASFEILEICGAYCKLKVYDREETYSTEGLFAEVPLSDEEFKAKYKDGAAVVIEQLKNEMSARDHVGTHEMWNSWICTDPYEFAAECEKNQIDIIGWFPLGREAREFVGGMWLDIGIVAQYRDEDTRFWCHARKKWIDEMIEEWEEDINDQIRCCDYFS